jgi:predicted nucleotidyltransferase
MLTNNEILTYLRTNKENFRTEFGIEKIGIFGSYARNEQTEQSDIDIIIDIPRNTENIFEKRIKLKEIISKYFEKEVDICHERAIKPIFKDIILNETIYV